MPALIDIITKDSTDRSVAFKIIDDTTGLAEQAVEHNTAGIALWYRREGGAKVAITPVALASLTTDHTDGGIEHIDDGDYRVDVPDAAFAGGANYVDFGGTVTGMIVIAGRVRLVDFDLEDNDTFEDPDTTQDVGDKLEDSSVLLDFQEYDGEGIITPASVAATVYKDDLATEIPDATGITITSPFASNVGAVRIKIDTSNDTGKSGYWVAGSSYLVKVTTTVASPIYGEATTTKVRWFRFSLVASTSTTVDANLTEILGTTITETTAGRDAANFSTFLDNNDAASAKTLDDIGGSAESVVLQSTTIATLATQLSFTLATGSADDDAYNGCMLIVEDQTTAVQKARVQVSDYVGSTRTITLLAAPEFTIATGDTVKVIATPKQLEGLIDPALEYVPLVTLSYTGTSGTTLHMRIDVVDGYGRIIDVNSLDAAATASMTVSEHSQDGGSDMFTIAFAAVDQTRKGFEQSQSNPGFTDDRQYIAQTTVTINGTPYVNTETVVNFG